MTRSFTLLSNLPTHVLQRWRNVFKRFVASWKKQNLLKLNDEKTAVLLFGLRQQLPKVSLPFITIGDSLITPSSQARNLGVIFDSTMTLKPHISNIVRVSSFYIRNVGRIRKYLNQSAAE